MKLIHPLIPLPLPLRTSDMLSQSRLRSEACLISPQPIGKAIPSQRSAFKRIPIKKNRAKKSQKTFKGGKVPPSIEAVQFRAKNEKIELSKANRFHLGAKSQDLDKFTPDSSLYLDPSYAVLFSSYPTNQEVISEGCLLQPKNQFTSYNHEISHQEHLKNSETFQNKPAESSADNGKEGYCLFGSSITIGEDVSEEPEKACKAVYFPTNCPNRK